MDGLKIYYQRLRYKRFGFCERHRGDSNTIQTIQNMTARMRIWSFFGINNITDPNVLSHYIPGRGGGLLVNFLQLTIASCIVENSIFSAALSPNWAQGRRREGRGGQPPLLSFNRRAKGVQSALFIVHFTPAVCNYQKIHMKF